MGRAECQNRPLGRDIKMNYSSGQLNRQWSNTIIETLISHDITYFCYSPGSRSTPLALAIAENPKVESFIHFDERGTAFHALGYAKAKKKPVVMITTSGTAVGNIFPAIMESSLSKVPLILLTADRPAELRHVKANQTVDQIKIFGEYVRYFFDLPTPSSSVTLEFLTHTLTQAVGKSLHPLPGPVHINCPFPEPLFDELPLPTSNCQSTKIFFPDFHPQQENIQSVVETLDRAKNGVIILGALDSDISDGVHALAKKLNWPIFPDIISSFREKANWEYAIAHYHHLIVSSPDLHVDAIIHIGEQWVSKQMLQWITKQKGSPIIHISKFVERCDPMHVITHKIVADEKETCYQLASQLAQKHSTQREEWGEISSEIQYSLAPFFEDTLGLTEPKVVKVLESYSSDYAIFLANSMPIRDGDMFFFPQELSQPIFANRGVSGIDGNIATCAGIAEVMPLIAVIGDQTLLHDLNSLAQLKKTRFPLKLIVINNQGGGIFSFLPIHKRKDVLESHFAAAHDWTFEKAAELFSIPYLQPNATADLHEALHQSGSMIIEVHTNREENYTFHQRINEAAAHAVQSLLLPR